ncbi:ferric iron reductase [Streptomyces sp. Ru71]|uniref:(2Fe-2S)-binding protein n=1 Tax=Streptomyces sp. Ru71 TaxID=2080746 RepID=UPI000CDE274B|nr:(2Fe-2S)-binding protein [Streptomyces sp. Ru71]POX53082.1 ferric iron reductase [Streptomyces sp. Ru71]
MDLDPGLAALRPLGGFFLLHVTSRAPRPLPTLADAYGDDVPRAGGDPLAIRVRKVAGSIRAPEPRVAASIAHQGLASRLWSVALGSAALYGTVLDLDPRLLHWDPDAGAPDDLWLTEARPRDDLRPALADTAGERRLGEDPAPPVATAAGEPHPWEDPAHPVPAALADAVLAAHLRPLGAALRARYRLAPGLLRGNAASALVGAAGQLGRWATAHGRPEVAARARALTAALLAHPELAGAGTFTAARGFRRRSCCLYYRVPGGGVCGDCCFPSPPRSSPRAPSE